MRRNWRAIAGVLGVLALSAVLLPTGAGAQKVANPGSFSLASTGGQIIIGPMMNIRLNPRLVAECADTTDNDADGKIDLADPQCVAGPGGEPASADDSELANGFQPKVDVSIVGNIDAAGNMTIAPSGVVFPPSYVKLNHPVDGSVAIVRVDLLPTAAATGTLNPLTGQMVLNVKLRAKLSGDLWGNSVSSDCSIGTAGNPIAVRFTTDKLPSINGGPALSGSKYDPAGGTAMLVSNDFYVPGASGCLAGGWLDINDTINQATKLPSQVGKNLATLSGKITPIIGAGVTANLGHDPLVLTGDAPFSVAFNSTGSSAVKGPVTYSWDFGDGATSTEGNPVHVFTAAGLHTTTLTVTDADGDSVSKSVKVTVNGGTVNQIPVARVATNPTPATGNAPLAVAFDGSTSTVGDGPGTYEWTFGDGTSATGVSTSHTYANAGTYTATLKVTDNNGDVSTANVTVTANTPPVNPVPIARITTNPTPATGNAPLAVAFSGSTSTVADSPGTYLWTFGDGTSATGVNVSHTYANAGTYTATLKVTDSNGDVSTANVTVTANTPPVNPVPIARITTNPTPATGNAPLAVAFSGSTSTVADSPGTYLWTFGDGASATGVNVSHTYTAPGNYTATLKVTDSNGDSNTANVAVKVNDPTPPATQDTVSVLFGGSVNYQNSGGGTGNIGVAHDAFGLVSVSGYLDVPSKVSGTARVTVNVNRLWILPIWTGTITVNDQAAGINQATPMLGGVNTSVTPRTAGSTTSWFKLGSFPDLIQPYSLTWSVTDVN